jgi:endonuclease YncB( thermonuclease family)
MYDTVEGPVLDVIDGDTVDISVAHMGKHNKFNYGNTERIRIAGINAPELNTTSGLLAKSNLKAKLNGRIVRCTIHSRDAYSRLISDVEYA